MNNDYPKYWDEKENAQNQVRNEKIKELGMTKAEYWNHICREEVKAHENYKKLSKSEEAYRRGYIQGFVAGRNPDVDFEEVTKWRYSNETVAPPGSGLAGMHLDGLTEEEEHRFFINRLKKIWEE